MSNKNHIACSIRDDGVGVCDGVIKEKFHLSKCALCGICLLGDDGAEGGKHS